MAINDIDYKREIEPKIKEFIDSNEKMEFAEFMAKAKSTFGLQVEIAEKQMLFEKISSIERMVKFFFILAIIAIVIYAISAFLSMQ